MKITKIITCLALLTIAVIGCKKDEELTFGSPPSLKTAMKDTTPQNVMFPAYGPRPAGLISGQ